MNPSLSSNPWTPPNTQPVLPPVANAWQPSFYLHRLSDEQGFAWLSALRPSVEGTPAGNGFAFGINLIYLHHDVLAHYPNELVLSLPTLQAPPTEHFFACTSKGLRWFWIVVLRRNAAQAFGLVFEVSPMVLMLPITGIRDRSGLNIPIQPRMEVLAPMDGHQVRHQQLNPATGEYFVVQELLPPCPTEPIGQQANTSELSHALGLAPSTQPVSHLYFMVGSPAFGMPIQVNTDMPLMNLVASLRQQAGNEADAMGGAL
jgi:hypothetical protein